MDIAFQRIDKLMTGITALTGDHPAQSLQLLRATSGACRVEFLLQALPIGSVSADTARMARDRLKQGLCAVLHREDLPRDAWEQAIIPTRLGGLGLRDPTLIHYAARFSSLLSAKSLALEMGASEWYVEREPFLAKSAYERFLQVQVPTDTRPSKELQAQLTEPIYQRMWTALVDRTPSDDKKRLLSVSTSHATSWTLDSPLIPVMLPGEYYCGLLWILGLSFREGAYICPDCGKPADPKGIHATTCQRSGAITIGHNKLQYTVGTLYEWAEYSVEYETPVILGGEERRPADLLVHGLASRPTAIDFTAVTTVRASASSSTTSLLDEAALRKTRENLAPCAQAGWLCSHFVTDTYGALHQQARAMISSLIARRATTLSPKPAATVGRKVWSSVSPLPHTLLFPQLRVTP